MAHTEGPWTVLPSQADGGKGLCIQTESIGDIVAMIEGPTIPSDHDNARLMASAPQLLDALRLVELRLNQVQPGHGTRANDLRDYLLPPVRAAIAKATA